MDAGTDNEVDKSKVPETIPEVLPVMYNFIYFSNSSRVSEIDDIPPLFSHFDDISNDKDSKFSYKMLVYSGNCSSSIYRIAHSRGFSKVLL